MYINRIINQSVIDSLKTFQAVVITGPRQSGKTSYLRNEFGSRFPYVTFDDPVQQEFADRDPRGFVRQFADSGCILDEVQYAPSILPYIKMVIDERANEGARWIMTGFQQFGVMRNVTESLTGRVCLFDLLPFSVEEAARRPQGPASEQEALWKGGYPAVATGGADRDLWAQSYLRSYVERDLRQIISVRDLGTFQTFLGLIAARHSQIVSLAEVSRDAGISQPTCRQWLNVLESSYIVHQLRPFFANVGKRLTKSPKVYFIDPIIPAYLTRQPDPASLWSGSMGGAFFEGLVVMEALKAYRCCGKPADIFFWRSHDGLKVDLLLQARGRVYPVEIKQTATPTHRHAEALLKLRSTLGPSAAPGRIVCTVDAVQTMANEVVAMPWHQFGQWVRELLTDRKT